MSRRRCVSTYGHRPVSCIGRRPVPRAQMSPSSPGSCTSSDDGSNFPLIQHDNYSISLYAFSLSRSSRSNDNVKHCSSLHPPRTAPDIETGLALSVRTYDDQDLPSCNSSKCP